MAEDNGRQGHAISSPLVIVICIAVAVIVVVIVAALYRLCRRVNTEAGGDVDSRTWNPNQRNHAQDRYMEEVRWRNNAIAWQHARASDVREYQRGWFREHLEEQRIGTHSNRTPDQEISAEEFLSHVNENPYQELLDQRSRDHIFQARKYSPEKDHRRTQLGNTAPHLKPAAEISQEASKVESLSASDQINDSGIRIMINDEAEDIVGIDLPNSSRFPPRQSRMFRSSSIYSGDALLPSNHLHLVQSSSSYAFREGRPSRVQQNINNWEQRSQLN